MQDHIQKNFNKIETGRQYNITQKLRNLTKLYSSISIFEAFKLKNYHNHVPGILILFYFN
jgi:hypothetical protein